MAVSQHPCLYSGAFVGDKDDMEKGVAGHHHVDGNDQAGRKRSREGETVT
jgi:hypothetical protein